jgi:hypothetical protein
MRMRFIFVCEITTRCGIWTGIRCVIHGRLVALGYSPSIVLRVVRYRFFSILVCGHDGEWSMSR